MGKAGIKTKQRLIDTATELIWKNSYGAVSVDEICTHAKVMKGSFYYYFPSKIDLALAVMDDMLETTMDKMGKFFIPDKDGPLLRFEAWADFVSQNQANIAQKYGHVCGCPFASLCTEIADGTNGLRVKFNEFSLWYRNCFANNLNEMVTNGSLSPAVNVQTLALEIFIYYLVVARATNDLHALQHIFKTGLLRLLRMDRPESRDCLG